MKFCLALIGTPRTMFAQATPNSRLARNEPMTVAHSHVARHAGRSSLAQNSNDTPRMISANSTRKSAM